MTAGNLRIRLPGSVSRDLPEPPKAEFITWLQYGTSPLTLALYFNIRTAR